MAISKNHVTLKDLDNLAVTLAAALAVYYETESDLMNAPSHETCLKYFQAMEGFILIRDEANRTYAFVAAKGRIHQTMEEQVAQYGEGSSDPGQGDGPTDAGGDAFGGSDRPV